MSDRILTPAEVEQMMVSLSTELESLTEQMENDEQDLYAKEGAFEISRARVLEALSRDGVRRNAATVDAMVLLECKREWEEMREAKRVCEADRRQIARVKYQIDVARSLNASVRSSMEIM